MKCPKKSIAAVLLTAAFIIPSLSLTGCNTDASGEDALPSVPVFTENEEKLNFTYDDLYNANLLSEVLYWHSSVKGSYRDSAGDDYDFCIYTVDGTKALISTDCDNPGGYEGWYRGLQFSLLPGERVSAMPCADYPGLSGDDYISAYFQRLDMEYLYETDENIVFAYKYSDGYTMTMTVNRGTLLLQSCEATAPTGYTYSVELTYDADTSDINLLDSWAGELRCVTIITQNADKTAVMKTFKLPCDWKLFAAENFFGYTAYLEAEHTVAYKYPGDDIDYSVYLSASNDND